MKGEKMKRLLFAMLIMIGLVGCLPKKQIDKQDANEQAQIESLLKQMTLDEKIGMLHGNSKFTSTGVARLGIPELHLSDGPHGVREEISRDSWAAAGWTNDSCTYFPTGTALAATWNPALAMQGGEALGEEARWRGKDILLGPGINIMRTPLNGRNFEYMGEDPYLASKMCVPLIQGIQSKDVAACIKHYLGNNQETDRGTVNVEMSDRALHEIYLPGFKAAVQQADVYSLMGAYNKFRGTWCCENKFLMTDLLRDELGFRGIAMSDWAAVHTTVESANSGLDLEMGTDSAYNRYYFADKLLDAVKKGEVKESVIDEKVSNILRVMIKTKIIGEGRQTGSFTTPEHSQAAYNVAKESIVLLKNDKQVLPIQSEKIKTIAVIGDNATRKHAAGGNSSGLKAKYEVTPLAGLQNRLGNSVKIAVAQGYEKQSSISWDKGLTLKEDKTVQKKLLAEAVELARKSDVAIVFAGINHDYDTESYDRPDMELPYGQEQLIQEVAKANPNTIVVFTAGSPLNLSRINDQVPAMVWAWYNGSEGGNALADVLLGKVNPSGKMLFTIPVSLNDSPAHAMGNYPGKNLEVNYAEDILVGYRWYSTKNIDPMYAFGHGLSYTTFEYSDLQTTVVPSAEGQVVQVSFKLKNTGTMDGAEVAQVYVADLESSVLRPEEELRAFQKVFLKAGETTDVSLQIKAADLAFYSESAKKWVLEPGDFEIRINSSSRDNRLKNTITLKSE